MLRLNGLLVSIFMFLAYGGASAAATTCASLSQLNLPHTTITGAESFAAGKFTPPAQAVFRQQQPSISVAFCRVTGSIKPTSDSDIKFEVWLPESGWTGRYESVGNGGFAGSITAALFLKRFVEHAKTYAHFDIFGWTPTSKPGRPRGGEAQALRACFGAIAERFAK